MIPIVPAKNGPRPRLHESVREYVRHLIESLPSGSLLPTEVELARRMGSSRMTVRQALADLQRAGLVRRRVGVGTFTTDAKTWSRLPSLENYLDDWMAQGRVASVKIRSFKVVELPPIPAGILGETTGYHLERVRSVDREPLAVDNRWLLKEIGELLTVEDLRQRPIHRILTESLHMEITAMDLAIGAGACNPDEARLLGIAKGAPVLQRRMTLYGRRDRAIGTGSSTYRGDRFEFSTRVIGPS